MIAGADNETSIKDLERLKKDYPFVEWGILFTKHKSGRDRYPSPEWIWELDDADVGNMSAHFWCLCQRDIRRR